ncbi:hypothetical protein [Nesterenkonia sphaerica]|uniref:Uncharacterized protein n=1 Tax=Nesterenkonia sphaerica TaxID=1804988 RepID=A0A5R9ACH3_9MICC|nr:hypothetical protein [Nesterenkonia sphaerica]TLP75725.1 hypothetical protein FEF27_06725 [Nesterenkonia sphaerica]
MEPTRGSAIYFGLAGLVNLSVFVTAWDFFGLFRGSQPPFLSIVVIGLSIVALFTTVWATTGTVKRVWLRRITLFVVLAASLLTVVGEVLVLNSEDGNIGVGLIPVLGVFLHLLLVPFLVTQAFIRGALPDQ